MLVTAPQQWGHGETVVLSDRLMFVLRGFVMGIAELIPGVSSGTFALVFGFYNRLINAVESTLHGAIAVVRNRGKGFKEFLNGIDWAMLLPLGLGMAVAVFGFASFMEHQLEANPLQVSAVFFGLVGGSILVALRLVERWDNQLIALMVVTAAVFAVFLGLTSGDVLSPPLWAVFLAATVAICAMILPGISGSFVLLMLGMYEPTIDAVADRDIGYLAVFAAGALVGLTGFSKGLRWALTNHGDRTLAALIGLMIGSLRVLWPWPDGTESAELGAPDGYVGLCILLAAVSFAFVALIPWLAERTGHDSDSDVAATR